MIITEEYSLAIIIFPGSGIGSINGYGHGVGYQSINRDVFGNDKGEGYGYGTGDGFGYGKTGSGDGNINVDSLYVTNFTSFRS